MIINLPAYRLSKSKNPLDGLTFTGSWFYTSWLAEYQLENYGLDYANALATYVSQGGLEKDLCAVLLSSVDKGSKLILKKGNLDIFLLGAGGSGAVYAQRGSENYSNGADGGATYIVELEDKYYAKGGKAGTYGSGSRTTNITIKGGDGGNGGGGIHSYLYKAELTASKGQSYGFSTESTCGNSQKVSTKAFGTATDINQAKNEPGLLFSGAGGAGFVARYNSSYISDGVAGGEGGGSSGACSTSVGGISASRDASYYGGGSGGATTTTSSSSYLITGASGGGGGYSLTSTLNIKTTTTYNIIIGKGGEGKSASYSSNKAYSGKGGNGLILLRNIFN